MSKQKGKKTKWGKIINGIGMSVVVISLILIIYATVSLARNRFVQFFGYSFHIIVTDSMEPEILVNDLVIAKKTDKKDIKIDDDIVFVSKDPVLRGNMVVHRVVDIKDNGNFVTQGIKIGATQDRYDVETPIGKVVAVNTNLGKVFGAIVKYRIFVFIALLLVLFMVIIWEAFGISFRLKAQKQAKQEKAIEQNKENTNGGAK